MTAVPTAADFAPLAEITQNATFYGVLTPKEYDVTFVANDESATGSTAAVHMVYDSAKALTANGFDLDGARFLGWSTTAAGGVLYVNQEEVMNISLDGDDMSLYAVWLYVVPNSCVYDAANHAPSVSGSGVTMYFSFTELNDSNYTTGSASPENRKDAGTYVYYYYAKDTKVAMPGSVTMVIDKKPLTSISWQNTSLTYNGSEQKPTATAVGLCAGDTCTVTVTGEKLHTGTYTATASALSNANYTMPAATTTQFTIVAKAVTISFTVADKEYDGNVLADITSSSIIGRCGEDDVQSSHAGATAVFDNKNAGNGKAVTGSGFVITGVAVDTYHDYVLASQPTSTGNVLKVSVLIKSADAERTYNGQPLVANSVRVENGGFIGDEGFTYTVTGTLTDAGIVNNTFTYQLKANTNANNYQITAVPGTLTVHAASITNVTYSVFTGDYDGQAHNIISDYNATTVNSQPLTWLFSSDNVNWSEDMITVTVSGDSGTYYVKITAPNHNDELRAVLVSIGTIIIDAPAISGSVYTGSLYQPTVPQDPLYAVESNPGGTDVGTYYVTLVLTNPNNYEWKNSDNEYITIPYDITKANASATLTANTLTYNKSAQALIKADTVTGGTIGYSLTEGGVYTADIPAETNAGDYTVYWRITGDSNHFDADGSVPVKIMKATPVLVANVPTLKYNGAEQDLLSVTAPSEEISVLYSLNGGAFGTTVPTGTNAGNYTVSYKSEATANYNASVVGTTAPSVTVTIAKAVYDRSHIHFADASFQYDAVAHTIEITTDAGYPLPAEITPVYTNNTRTEVGKNSATVTFNVGTNYEAITGFTATLTIFVLDIQYTATGYDGTYDATAHAAMTVAVATPATGAVITYSATQYGTYTEECPTVTNAGNGTVWFKIVALGYTYRFRQVS